MRTLLLLVITFAFMGYGMSSEPYEQGAEADLKMAVLDYHKDGAEFSNYYCTTACDYVTSALSYVQSAINLLSGN